MRNFIHDELFAFRYESDQIIDLSKSYSAILAGVVVSADPNTVPNIVISHCDTEDGDFEEYVDPFVFGDDYQSDVMMDNSYYYVNMDVGGCKRFIKLNITFIDKTTKATATADWHTVFVKNSFPTSTNVSTS